MQRRRGSCLSEEVADDDFGHVVGQVAELRGEKIRKSQRHLSLAKIKGK